MQSKKHCKKNKNYISDLYSFTQGLCSRRKHEIQPQQSTINFPNHESTLFFLATQVLCMVVSTNKWFYWTTTPFIFLKDLSCTLEAACKHTRTAQKTCEPLKEVSSLSVPFQPSKVKVCHLRA